ncbi:putative Oxysterol-binding protein 4 [Blattamonas nauphoetae]|uniref:Oxysterol-binding protein 4 n=1 Tax=Blattamonas nauphoetae TaxID=2049346 RepID=A0ABQ9YG64_9EUKA|nr:putative Oxysterol-binding protein 4 [Blattamonas nauphoetae]
MEPSSNEEHAPTAPSPSFEQGNDEELIMQTEEDQEVQLDERSMNIFSGIIKELKNGAELSRMSLPYFVLEPQSMTERLTDFLNHADLLIGALKHQDPLDRFFHLAKWYISGFHSQNHGVKKPYNPILGETFKCFWNHSDGSRTWYLAEQVSHHPPITAFHIENKQHGIRIKMHLEVVMKWKGNSIMIKPVGQGLFYLRKPVNKPWGELITEDDYLTDFEVERYEFSFPAFYCRGLIIGSMALELCGEIVLTCPKNGITAVFDFKPKGMFKGKYNQFEGAIAQLTGDPKKDKQARAKPYFQMRGDWMTVSEFKDCRDTPTYNNGEWTQFLDIQSLPKTPRYIQQVSNQQEYESRVVWSTMSKALITHDDDTAAAEKNRIENKQRGEYKERNDRKEGWRQRYFHDADGKWMMNWLGAHNEEEYEEEKQKLSIEERLKRREEAKKTGRQDASLIGVELTAFNVPDATTLAAPPPMGEHTKKGKDIDVRVTTFPDLPDTLAHPWPMFSGKSATTKQAPVPPPSTEEQPAPAPKEETSE